MPTAKKFYSINDLVDMGFGSRTTIWRRMRAGQLPAARFGRSVRIPADAFEEFVAAHRLDTKQDAVAAKGGE